MHTFASYLWSLSFQISILVAFVALISFAFRRFQPEYHYWLWMIVIARLLMPVTITVPIPFSVTPAIRSATEDSISGIRNEFRQSESASTAKTETTDMTARESQSVSAAMPSPVQTPNSPPLIIKLLYLWAGIAGLGMIYYLICSVYVRMKMKSSIEVARDDILDFIREQSEFLGIRQQVGIYISDVAFVKSPSVSGMFFPKIYLPRCIAETWHIEDLKPVLMHELIHVRRHDLLINGIQSFVQIMFFFHPLVWYANARIREYREMICDDLAVFHTNNKRKKYTLSILMILDNIDREMRLGMAGVHYTERKNSLVKRLIRIANETYQSYQPMRRAVSFGIVAIGLVGLMFSCDVVDPNGRMDDRITETSLIANVEKKMVGEETPSNIILKIINDGEYLLNGRKINSETLLSELKAEMVKTGLKSLIINSEEIIEINTYNHIYDMALEIGIRKIGFYKGEIKNAVSGNKN